MNPDFVVPSGRGYEAKRLYGKTIFTTPKQLKELREKNPTVLVFSDETEEPTIVASFREVEKTVTVCVTPSGSAIKIRGDNYKRLVRIKAEIEQRSGKIASMDDVIRELLKKYEGVRTT